MSPSPLVCINGTLRTARRGAAEGDPALRYDLVLGQGAGGVGSWGLWAVVRSQTVGGERGD